MSIKPPSYNRYAPQNLPSSGYQNQASTSQISQKPIPYSPNPNNFHSPSPQRYNPMMQNQQSQVNPQPFCQDTRHSTNPSQNNKAIFYSPSVNRPLQQIQNFDDQRRKSVNSNEQTHLNNNLLKSPSIQNNTINQQNHTNCENVQPLMQQLYDQNAQIPQSAKEIVSPNPNNGNCNNVPNQNHPPPNHYSYQKTASPNKMFPNHLNLQQQQQQNPQFIQMQSQNLMNQQIQAHQFGVNGALQSSHYSPYQPNILSSVANPNTNNLNLPVQPVNPHPVNNTNTDLNKQNNQQPQQQQQQQQNTNPGFSLPPTAQNFVNQVVQDTNTVPSSQPQNSNDFISGIFSKIPQNSYTPAEIPRVNMKSNSLCTQNQPRIQGLQLASPHTTVDKMASPNRILKPDQMQQRRSQSNLGHNGVPKYAPNMSSQNHQQQQQQQQLQQQQNQQQQQPSNQQQPQNILSNTQNNGSALKPYPNTTLPPQPHNSTISTLPPTAPLPPMAPLTPEQLTQNQVFYNYNASTQNLGKANNELKMTVTQMENDIRIVLTENQKLNEFIRTQSQNYQFLEQQLKMVIEEKTRLNQNSQQFFKVKGERDALLEKLEGKNIEINTVRNEVLVSTAELEKATKELNEFKNSIDELESKIQVVLQENTRLNQSIYDVSQQCNFYKETASQVELIINENEKLTQSLQQTNLEREQLMNRCDQLERMSQNSAQMYSIQPPHHLSSQQSSEYQISSGNMMYGVSNSNNQIVEQLRIDDLEKKIDLLIQENGKLNNVIEVKVSEIDSIHLHYAQEIKRLQEFEAANISLMNERDSLVQKLEQSQSNVNNALNNGYTFQMGGMVEDLQNKIKLLLGENDKLNNILKQKQMEIADLREIQSKIKELLDQNDALNSIVVNTTNSLQTLKVKYEEAEKTITEMSQERRNRETDNQNNFDRERATLKERIKVLEEEQIRLEKSLAEKVQEVEQFLDLDNKVAIVVEENEKLQSHLDVQNDQILQIGEIIKGKDEDLRAMQENLNDHKMILKQFEDKLNLVVMENEKLNEIISTHFKNNDLVTVQELQRKISFVQQEKEQYMHLAEQLKRELDSYQFKNNTTANQKSTTSYK